MYTIVTPVSFLKTAKKFLNYHPELKDRFKNIIDLLQKNPNSPALKIHPLSGKLKGMQAVHLTYKYRITLIVKFTQKEIILLDIGNHNEVYR